MAGPVLATFAFVLTWLLLLGSLKRDFLVILKFSNEFLVRNRQLVGLFIGLICQMLNFFLLNELWNIYEPMISRLDKIEYTNREADGYDAQYH